MTKTKIGLATAALIVLAIAGALTLLPSSARSNPNPKPQEERISEQQRVWLSALRWCESRGNDLAINKQDRDGTPSYGRYQFKPSTYEHFAEKYGLASTTDYMNAQGQQRILESMLLDEEVSTAEFRNRQFPDCIQNKVGNPPR